MKLKKFDSINVIPLIDVLLVLIVIILTTASFVTLGKIELSQSNEAKKELYMNSKKVSIFIKNIDTIYIEDKKIDISLLDSYLQGYDKSTTIDIVCDKNLNFQDFIYLLDIIKSINLNNINLVTEIKK